MMHWENIFTLVAKCIVFMNFFKYVVNHSFKDTFLESIRIVNSGQNNFISWAQNNSSAWKQLDEETFGPMR